MSGATRRDVLTLGAAGTAAAAVVGLERLSTAGAFGAAAGEQTAWPSAVGIRPNGGLVTVSGGALDGSPGEPALVAGSRVVADAEAGTDAVTSVRQTSSGRPRPGPPKMRES